MSADAQTSKTVKNTAIEAVRANTKCYKLNTYNSENGEYSEEKTVYQFFQDNKIVDLAKNFGIPMLLGDTGSLNVFGATFEFSKDKGYHYVSKDVYYVALQVVLMLLAQTYKLKQEHDKTAGKNAKFFDLTIPAHKATHDWWANVIKMLECGAISPEEYKSKKAERNAAKQRQKNAQIQADLKEKERLEKERNAQIQAELKAQQEQQKRNAQTQAELRALQEKKIKNAQIQAELRALQEKQKKNAQEKRSVEIQAELKALQEKQMRNAKNQAAQTQRRLDEQRLKPPPTQTNSLVLNTGDYHYINFGKDVDDILDNNDPARKNVLEENTGLQGWNDKTVGGADDSEPYNKMFVKAIMYNYLNLKRICQQSPDILSMFRMTPSNLAKLIEHHLKLTRGPNNDAILYILRLLFIVIPVGSTTNLLFKNALKDSIQHDTAYVKELIGNLNDTIKSYFKTCDPNLKGYCNEVYMNNEGQYEFVFSITFYKYMCSLPEATLLDLHRTIAKTTETHMIIQQIKQHIVDAPKYSQFLNGMFAKKATDITNDMPLVYLRMRGAIGPDHRNNVRVDVRQKTVLLSWNPSKSLKTDKHRYFQFGPFAGVFENTSNSEITSSEELRPVREKLDSGTPVFVLGYGASGSGKTSTLISANNNDKYENGVLVSLLQSPQAESVQLYLNEFYVTPDIDRFNRTSNSSETVNSVYTAQTLDGIYNASNANAKTSGIKNYTASKTFIKNNNGKGSDHIVFTKNSSNQFETDGLYKMKVNVVEGNNTDTVTIPNSLGQAIDLIMNTSSTRRISPTTNNPNSSRSHVLISLVRTNKATSKAKNSYLFVGDFAGVENEFNCSDLQTLIDMANSGFETKDKKRSYTDALIKVDLLKKKGICSSEPNDVELIKTTHLPDDIPVFSPTDRTNAFTTFFSNRSATNDINNPADDIKAIVKAGGANLQFRHLLILLSIFSEINLTNPSNNFKWNNTQEVFDIDTNLFKSLSKPTVIRTITQDEYMNIFDGETEMPVFDGLILYADKDERGGSYDLKIHHNYSGLQLSDDFKTATKTLARKYKTYLNLCAVLLRKMKRVCQCRLAEGRYINKTLANTQNTINNIIRTHYKDSLRITPSFSAPATSFSPSENKFACGDVFCNPLFDDCFQLPRNPDDDFFNASYVFDVIKNHLPTNNTDNPPPLAMVVFGVFNAKDEVPKQAYIYDSDLRLLLKFFKNINVIEYALKNKLYLTNPQMQFIKKFAARVADDGTNIKQSLVESLNTVLRTMKSWIQYYSPDASTGKMYGFTKLEVDTLLNKFKNKVYTTATPTSTIIQQVGAIISAIEKVNSISAMGTLEFLDSLTKYDFAHPAWTASCNPEKATYMNAADPNEPQTKADQTNRRNNAFETVQTKRNDGRVSNQRGNIQSERNSNRSNIAAREKARNDKITDAGKALNKYASKIFDSSTTLFPDGFADVPPSAKKATGGRAAKQERDRLKLDTYIDNLRTYMTTFMVGRTEDALNDEMLRYKNAENGADFREWVKQSMTRTAHGSNNENWVIWFRQTRTSSAFSALPAIVKNNIIEHMNNFIEYDKLVGAKVEKVINA